MIGGPQGSGINASARSSRRHAHEQACASTANIEYHSNIMASTRSTGARRRARTSARTRRRPTSSLRSTTRRSRATAITGGGATHFGHLHEINPVAASSTTAMSTSIQSLQPHRSPFLPAAVHGDHQEGPRRGGQGRAGPPLRGHEEHRRPGRVARAVRFTPSISSPEVITGQFQGKAQRSGALNVRAARLAFDHVKTNFDIAGFPTR